MIKGKFINNKGVSLISLVITVVVLVIITNVLLYNLGSDLGVTHLRNMQNDISNLREKILSYYAKKGKIPAKLEYSNTEKINNINSISETADTGKFYVIDLTALENLTLNYGQDYKKIQNNWTQSQINELSDLYIINETSNNIFYVDGITLDDQTYYTDYEVGDSKGVNLRYVDNIQIPQGFTYIEGTLNTGIKIKDENDLEYTWIVQNQKITNVPVNVQVDNQEAFIESVNAYKGYFKSNTDNSVEYLSLEEKWTPSYEQRSGKYKDKNGNIVTVPEGFQVCTTLTKNTVNDGLIIKNSETNDRYVWIEVPKSIFKTATSETDYNNIKNDLENYVAFYKDGYENYKDIWYAFDGNTLITEETENLTNEQKLFNNGCGLNYSEYRNLRNKMYSSIYTNGGFWIGQYETGSEAPRTSTNDETTASFSKEGKYPYNYISCINAVQIAQNAVQNSNNENSYNFSSSLMFGIQWDLVLKFLENKTNKLKNEISNDSSNWGNYYKSNFVIKRGKYTIEPNAQNSWKDYTQNTADYVINSEKLASNNVLLTTGVSEKNKVLNIYDFAGNICEWTLEMSGTSGEISSARGGAFNSQNSNYYGASRNNFSQNQGNYTIGFRISLF